MSASAQTRELPSRLESFNRLERAIGVLHRRLKRVLAERAAAVHPDLMPASYAMLMWIAEHGPVRAAALVEEFRVDKGAVSRQLQHLSDLGLVEREPDPADGRASLLSATSDAVRRLDEVAQRRRVYYRHRLEGWSAQDLADLAEGLARYNEALER